ncbi:MAG: carboxylating nicotinate-nucleotide diphosphorylase [Porticoccaceae bacterium]
MTAIDIPQALLDDIPEIVARAIEEDRGSGDITAELIPATKQVTASVISREAAIICGRPWVDEVFRQLDSSLAIEWHILEGAEVEADQSLFTISGNGRAILTGERCALNFLQTLSATATTAREYANLAAGSDIRILDTRKTIPGLRLAQKYAVLVGGCHNHRIGLYDAFLIKENHIIACGGIPQAVAKARQIAPAKTVEVEVESLSELQQAVDAGADVAMLDNFSTDQLSALKTFDLGTTKIEVSGNITQQSIPAYRGLPIDYISTGSLTKHIRAIDLSMRLAD